MELAITVKHWRRFVDLLLPILLGFLINPQGQSIEKQVSWNFKTIFSYNKKGEFISSIYPPQNYLNCVHFKKLKIWMPRTLG